MNEQQHELTTTAQIDRHPLEVGDKPEPEQAKPTTQTPGNVQFQRRVAKDVSAVIAYAETLLARAGLSELAKAAADAKRQCLSFAQAAESLKEKR